MPTSFLRSPADSLAGVTAKDKLRRSRTRGKLLQEDGDQEPVGPQRETAAGIRRFQGPVRGQDTQTGSVGQEPSDRDMGGSAFPPSSHDEPVPMSEGEVQSAVHKMTWDAIEYIDQELSPFRALATKYYQGEPFGNEEEGRSQVVITELRDTVLMILPSLMRLFWGAERAVEYGPRTMNQVAMAEQATQFIWDIVVNEDNRGFVSFYEWFKDALVKRLGIVKYWWDDATESRAYEASMLPLEHVIQLQSDPEIHIDAVEHSDASQPGLALFDVEYTQTKRDGRIRFLCMPPEEFLFTRGARATTADRWVPGTALFVGHRTELTRSQLLEIGVPEDVIEEWAFKDVSLDHNQEEIARQHIVKPDTSAIGPIATQKALYIEGYPYLDVDGDGIAELRKIVMLGPSYHVISNEPCARRPFAVLCPDPEPHTIVGQGIADWTMDLQRMNSMIWRSMLDSLALSINPRMAYLEGEVSVEDLLNTEIGSPIRMRQPPAQALQVIEHPFVGQQALPVLEKTAEIKENRSGVTKASAGLGAAEMQSTTKMAVAGTLSSSQAHIELIARIFAETGVKQLFKGLLALLVENPQPPRIVRTQGQYIEMDPRSWDADLDVCVKIAIGAGMDEEKYQVLAETSQKMEQIFGTMGLANPIVSLKQYRDTLVKMLKLRGRMDAEAFYKDVDPNWQPPPPPVQDPNMVIAQAEQMKAQTQHEAAIAKAQLEQQKHEMQAQAKIQELELKLQQQAVDATLEREKMALQAETQIAMAELNAKVTLNQQQFEATVDELRAHLEHVASLHDSSVKAQASAIQGAQDIQVEHDDQGRISRLKIKHPETGAGDGSGG